MIAASLRQTALPCCVITHRGIPCGVRSIQMHPELGPLCALHLYHRRRTLQARPKLQVRVDMVDLATLDTLAQEHGLTRSDAMRRLIRRAPLPKALVEAKTYLELRRQGNNINQLAKALNRGDEPELLSIQVRLDDLRECLQDLALQLCGGSGDEAQENLL